MTVVDTRPVGQIDDPFADRRILVLLASYRDPELPRTIANALAQAAYPEHLRFSICHQYDDETAGDLSEWDDDPRFSIDAIPFDRSKGCCWARARTFERYDDEPYILQVDAHTRFAARWDQRYIDMFEALGNTKAVLTCYPPPYRVDESGNDHYHTEGGIHRLKLIRLEHDLTTRQATEQVSDTAAPGLSPLLAAGQIFAAGSFCVDVPYDPEIYFAGEEISLAVRAYTHGYDLYYPNENLVWHRYSHGVPLHWQDHPDEQSGLHDVAVERLRVLLSDRGHELGRFGLGPDRTLEDFQHMADIDFAQIAEPGWSARGTLLLDTSSIDFSQQFAAWVFALFAGNGKELHRADITDDAILTGAANSIELDAPDLEAKPESYILWPILSDGSFGTRTSHDLDMGLVVPPTDGPGMPQRVARPETAAEIAPPPAPERPPAAASTGTTISIDRSVIEPRDDYRCFALVFLDNQGTEVRRVEMTRPDVLDLSTAEFTLHNADVSDAVAYAVVPIRANGAIGAIRVQPLAR